MCYTQLQQGRGKTWALTKRLERILFSCDRRMLRYMAGVTWMDHVSSLKVARCWVMESGVVLNMRLRCIGHVVRRDKTDLGNDLAC